MGKAGDFSRRGRKVNDSPYLHGLHGLIYHLDAGSARCAGFQPAFWESLYSIVESFYLLKTPHFCEHVIVHWNYGNERTTIYLLTQQICFAW